MFSNLTSATQSQTDPNWLIGKAAGLDEAIEGLADVFEEINPRFNRESFLDACYSD